jgi:RHS repeat-associated protein
LEQSGDPDWSKAERHGQMPGRQFSQEEYRYGFNGMEKDDELAGEGNSYTTHFRQYDSRIGKWLSVDPKYSSFASSSPYLSFNGNPILYSDILGDSSVVDRSGYMTHYDPEDEDLRIFMPDQDGNLYHIGDLGGEVCSDMWFENLLNENARIAEELWDPGIPLFPAMNIIREKSFKGRVRKEGEWDYKYRSPSNMNKYTKEMPLHLLGVSFYRSDTDNGSGDLAGTLFIYGNDIGRPEDLNNMHFGVIGNAYGLFTEEFMLKQAGAVERAKWKDEHGRDVPQDWRPVLKVHSRGSGSGSNYDVNYTKTIIGAPFGDSPMDHNWIKKGFIFYPSKLF